METVGLRRLWQAVLAIALFGVLPYGSCVSFEVQDSTNKTCIKADLSINFTVGYNASGKQATAQFPLPRNSTVGVKSTCGQEKEAPLLIIVFGNHSLGINFTTVNAQYHVDELVFTYDLSDKTLFPNASESEKKSVSTNTSSMSANLNSVYHCRHPHFLSLENVNVTFYDVMLEAYMSNNTFSKNETICKEDVAPTSAPSPSPTTVPVNPKQPDVGEYRVNTTSGAACLLAKMGLKLNFTYSKKDGKVANYEYNIDPKTVGYDGLCSNSSAILSLSSPSFNVSFTFKQNSSLDKVYLAGVDISAVLPDTPDQFKQSNSSLLYLQTKTQKSFKCITKQAFQITSNFSIDTYNLQVQAFNIKENKFGPAIECAEDQNGMLVPIIVGAALAGLVLIVLIAYLIGRKRSHAGYQTI